MIRLRFAPSPTGFVHIGSLRTVLFNYLITKNLNGKLILRIEDTDQKRTIEGAQENLINILNWLGITFDEGPHIGGEFAPYIQSERRNIYEKWLEKLLEIDGAYHCFCTPERLEKMRTDQQSKKLPPRYDRCCRDLSPQDCRQKLENGEKFVIRQKMPREGSVVVNDELRGEIIFHADDLDDQVLIKSDGMPTYQFANVIDDHEMEITHVVRGDEWLSSFPKNILLYQTFGWTPPKYIHIPLVLDIKGGKLSKRTGDVAVEEYKAKGYLPEALINFCVLMGWHPSQNQIDSLTTEIEKEEKKTSEIFSLEKLEKIFNYTEIGTSPAIFDTEKLDYLNGYYIRQKSLDELFDLAKPFLEKYWLEKKSENFFQKSLKNKGKDFIKKVIRLEQERLKKLSEIGELTELFFVDNLIYESSLLLWKKVTTEQAKNNLETILELLEKIPEENWTNDSIEEGIIDYLKIKELKIGEYLWPMRVALTGRQASPSPFDVAEVLGREESLKRIKNGVLKLN